MTDTPELRAADPNIYRRCLQGLRLVNDFRTLYNHSASFRQTADILKGNGWPEGRIVTEWCVMQDDDEAGDYDVP